MPRLGEAQFAVRREQITTKLAPRAKAEPPLLADYAIEATNAHVSAEEPWKRTGAAQAAVLAVAADALRTTAHALAPFLPGTAEGIRRALAGEPGQLFPRKGPKGPAAG